MAPLQHKSLSFRPLNISQLSKLHPPPLPPPPLVRYKSFEGPVHFYRKKTAKYPNDHSYMQILIVCDINLQKIFKNIFLVFGLDIRWVLVFCSIFWLFQSWLLDRWCFLILLPDIWDRQTDRDTERQREGEPASIEERSGTEPLSRFGLVSISSGFPAKYF